MWQTTNLSKKGNLLEGYEVVCRIEGKAEEQKTL